ncbi:MAG: hypothetical protein AB7F99_16270 [Vicinamibacterales bacterium]
MGQALVTTVGIGLLGIITAAVFGLTASDTTSIARHVTFGIFSTMVILLAHSMMMFYLIGKGKAVKDALVEGGHPADQPTYRQFVSRISLARRPVFSWGPIAMLVTMGAAILGASVDTGVLPPTVHSMIAYGAVACNLATLKIEIDALSASSRVVDEVNQLLEP